MFNSDGASVEKDEDNHKPEPGRSLRKLDQNLQGDDDDDMYIYNGEVSVWNIFTCFLLPSWPKLEYFDKKKM